MLKSGGGNGVEPEFLRLAEIVADLRAGSLEYFVLLSCSQTRWKGLEAPQFANGTAK
jgi:hypothetical protein